MKKIPSENMVRVLPKDAKVVKEVNGIKLYNINSFQNIMACNQGNLDVPAFDYYGNQITYGELPEYVDAYVKGFASLGLNKDSIITKCMPVMTEYYLSIFATKQLGAITNNPNLLFLKKDLDLYTTKKNSDTLIILDLYLPLIAEQLKKSGIKRVIIASLDDFLPEDRKKMFNDFNNMPKSVKEFYLDPEKLNKAYGELAKIRHIDFIDLKEVIEIGKKSKEKIVLPKADIDKDSIYAYTSGTTGAPKPIVYTEQSPNALIEMHRGLKLGDYVGDRSLLLIPPCHATGMIYAEEVQLSLGKTLVCESTYSKENFARNLIDFDINHALAPISFYIEGSRSKIEKGALKNFRRPCSGGEPATMSTLNTCNKWLNDGGCENDIALGGGAGELGSSVLTSYDLDPNTKTNETGLPLRGTYVKIVDPVTGKELPKGQRGIVHMSSAAAADRYLDNPKATKEYFYYDENGIKWGNLGDIGVQNENGSFTMLGRATDSYVDENGKTVYLFDTEYQIDEDDPMTEWEITAFKSNDNKHDVLAQVVLKSEYIGREHDVVNYLCEKYKVDGVKFYDKFETSETTGKRNYDLLKHDFNGYYKPLNSEQLVYTNYSPEGIVSQTIIDGESINTIKEKHL